VIEVKARIRPLRLQAHSVQCVHGFAHDLTYPRVALLQLLDHASEISSVERWVFLRKNCAPHPPPAQIHDPASPARWQLRIAGIECQQIGLPRQMLEWFPDAVIIVASRGPETARWPTPCLKSVEAA